MADSSQKSSLEVALIQVYRKALMKGIPVDEIEKQVAKHAKRIQVSEKVEAADEERREERVKHRTPALVRIGAAVLPVLFIGIGMVLMGNAVVPIASYYFNTAPKLSKSEFTAPIPEQQVLAVDPLVLTDSDGSEVAGVKDEGPIIIADELDYTDLSNWFGDSVLPEFENSAVQQTAEYVIDIPSLDIENALVTIGGTDLNNSLIAYPGTALPGQAGSPVIFGHSVLRQYYSPSERNPRRYNSIFSYIMTLDPGDRIYVTYEGVKYAYAVQDLTEVKPEDVHILTQQYDAERLKLVTCTPEGTYLRRGVVTAQLIRE